MSSTYAASQTWYLQENEASGIRRGSQKVKGIAFFTVGAALLWTVGAATAQSAPDFYAGKQVTLIVGASTGGGYDTQARLVARHFGKHIWGLHLNA